MPRRKRDHLKRLWGYAYHNLDLVMQAALDLKAEFEGDHPDFAEHCQVFAEAVLMFQQQWETFALAAWGSLPDKVERWIGQPNKGTKYGTFMEEDDENE